MRRPTITRACLVRLGTVGLGVALGIAIVLTPSAVQDAPLWVVWAALAIALTTTAGGVFGYGLDRWAELAMLRPIRIRDVAVPFASLLTVAMLAMLIGIVVPAAVHQGRFDWSALRGWALTAIAYGGAGPALAVMYGIRHVAADWPTPAEATGKRVAELIALRRLLQRLLAAAGSLAALSTLALGAAVAVRQSLPVQSTPGGEEQMAPQIVLIFGGVGSTLVALAYGPAITALHNGGRRLCDDLFPLHEAKEAATILSQAEDRHKLEQLLGLDRSVAADLQTGLTILGPLIASAAAAFLPH